MNKYINKIISIPLYGKNFLLNGVIIVILTVMMISLQQCKPGSLEGADIVLINGKIISVDSGFNIYSGVAIQDGKILAVGTEKEILSLKGDKTRLIDLKGRTVVPGLIDNHVHSVTASISELDKPLPDLKSISELLNWLKEEASKSGNGEWIVHPKFFFGRLDERRWPTLKELDKAAPDNPVFLNGSYGGMVNTKAIEISGFKPKANSDLILDPKTQKLSGIIRRSAFSSLPLDQSTELSIDEEAQALMEMFHEYNRSGITSVTVGSGSTDDLELLNNLYQDGGLTVRVFQNILLPFKSGLSINQMKDELTKLGTTTGKGNEWVKAGALKARIDGGILTGTAYLREPWGERASKIYGFPDPKYRGELFLSTDELTRIITAAYDSDWKFTAHVTGGGGVDTLLKAYEQVNKTRFLSERRYSIIHGNFFSTDAIQKMNIMGIYADMQPMWLYKDADLLLKALNERMLANFHPYHSMTEAGIIINGGSDHMVILDPDKSINPYNPFLSIYTLVTRKTENGTIFHHNEAISRKEALKLYTINNAYATFEEDMKGSIEPGKWADIVVLSDDILSCDTEDIPKIKPLLTMVGGKIVYQNEKFQ